MMAHSRKLLLLLLADDEEATSASSSLRNNLSPTINYSPDPELLPQHNSSSAAASPELTYKPQNSPFDSSMALTILVLLTALFFMAFFSVYIRRLSDDAADLHRRRQHHNTPSSSSSSSSTLRFRPSKGRGLDPSTVGSLPLIAYSAHATHPIDCAICLTEFEERETVKMIPCCRNVFHPGCIDTWLASHVSCPLCRSTKMYGVEEVCLSVMQVDNDERMSEDLRRSTVVESDTWTSEGPVGLRRTCSWSSLGQRVALQRSRSF